MCNAMQRSTHLHTPAWAPSISVSRYRTRRTARTNFGLLPPNATDSLARVKADETILFDPVPGRPDALNVVYAYPNEYSVGITSLGYQLVWAFLETSELTSVSRRFTDLADPQTKRRRVDLVGFSFSWELDYSNIVSMLEGMDIPVNAAERQEEHPIVFGGGPVLTANPEPYAAWFDCVLVGDGEPLLDDFVRAVHEVVNGGGSRLDILDKLCLIPGVYVPQFYEPIYDGDSIIDIRPLRGAPAYVEKQTYRGGTLASSTVVSPRMAWENIFMAEVVRSCPEMCRFCLASYLTLPFRAAPLEGSLIPTLERGLQVTDRIGLLGASVTQVRVGLVVDRPRAPNPSLLHYTSPLTPSLTCFSCSPPSTRSFQRCSNGLSSRSGTT